MIDAQPSTLDERVTGLSASSAVLLAAVAAGVLAQGGFYLGGRLVVCGLVAVAVVIAATTGSRIDRQLVPLAAAAAGLAVWTVARGLTAGGHWPTVLGTVGTLAVFVSAAALTVRADAGERETLVRWLTGVGALVAVTGWIGAAFRVPIWAVAVEGRLWRASSTLTYPNAAAAVLGGLALLALASLAARPASTPRALTAFVLVTGLGATQSRAGLIAFAAGLAVLCGLLRRFFAGPLLGAAVAVGALLPTTAVDAEPRPWVAAAGLVVGALIALVRHRGALVAVLAALVTVTALAHAHWSAVVANRGTLASWGRSHATSAALDLVAAHPWVGTGPGLARFVWLDDAGDAVIARFVHNEYLQLTVELGLVGTALLGVLIAAAGAIVLRARGGSSLTWAGSTAALVGFAVHSAFDFLWQPAALPLLAGLLIGLAGQTVRSEEVAPSITGEEEE
ncbi:O-antigen ligase family protein [Asanoa ferruginea]|nr:O-antigen ligase family protein [Asanoa ferruginea]